MARRNPLSRNAHCGRDYDACRTYEHGCPDEVADHADAVAYGETCGTCGEWPASRPMSPELRAAVAAVAV